MTSEKNRKAKRKVVPVRAFAGMFWGLTAALFVLAILSAIATIPAIRNSDIITGTVLGFNTVQNAIPYTEEDSGIHYYPIIQYQGEMEASESYVSPQPVPVGRFAIGEEVELRITRRGRVFFNNVWGKWGFPIVFAGAALIFAVSALAISTLGRSAKNA